MVKYLISKEAPVWLVSLIVHVKCAVFICGAWYLFQAFTFNLGEYWRFLYNIAFGYLLFWWILFRMGHNPHEWKYLAVMFRSLEK